MNKKVKAFKFDRVECPELVEGHFFFYMLECSDMSIYCGSSGDLPSRLKTHNLGKASEWTKIRRPVQLIYYEVYDDLLSVRRRELQVKGWSRSKKENLIYGIWKKMKTA
jgi:predicted GIY-YIG superfamily endonuclease